METTDPLSRFTDLIVGLHEQKYVRQPSVLQMANGHHELGAALAYLMGRIPRDKTFSRFEALEDFATMLHLGIAAEKFVEANSPAKAKDRNLSHFREILNKLSNSAANTAAQVFNSSNLSNESVQRLQVISENLSSFGVDPVISDTDMGVLIEMIDDLIEFIAKANVDARLRGSLLKTLGILRMEIGRVNIVGPEVVVDSMDKLLGQATRAGIASASGEEYKDGIEVLRKSVGVLEAIGKVIDAAQKFYPVIETAARALNWMP